MNGFDLVLVLLAASAAAAGYRLGFVARIVSWGGLVAGVALGLVLVPWIVEQLDGSVDPEGLVVVCMLAITAAGVSGQAAGALLGDRLRVHVPEGPARRTDRAVGAAASVLAVALVAWLLAPLMAEVAGWPARAARSSAAVAALDALLPPAPDPTTTLRDLLGERYPQVVDTFDPAPEVGPPPASSGLDQATADAVATSTVQVLAPACDAVLSGSGFFVAPDLVVTNAHVVAGSTEPTVETSDGRSLPTSVVAFDPVRDLALLATSGADIAPLPLADGAPGDIGAVFGHPGGGPLRLAPFEVADAFTANGTDIYDAGSARREVLVLSVDLEMGDSGSAVVDDGAEVIGVAFAVAPDRDDVAYALDTAELRAVLAGATGDIVGTGPCLG